MLDSQITFQIIISICVGLSYLAINHYKTFKKIEGFIKTYTIIATTFFLIYYLLFSKVDLKEIKNIIDFILESLTLTIPYLFFILIDYIGKSIIDEKINK